jgi:uncharacterized membrane protein
MTDEEARAMMIRWLNILGWSSLIGFAITCAIRYSWRFT